MQLRCAWAQAAHPARPSGAQARLAAHLCGDHALQLLTGDASFVRQLQQEFGFARVQVCAARPPAIRGCPPSDRPPRAALTNPATVHVRMVLVESLPGWLTPRLSAVLLACR